MLELACIPRAVFREATFDGELLVKRLLRLAGIFVVVSCAEPGDVVCLF